MSKVKVVGDENGNVIHISQNNPEYGYIRVQQETIQINEKGWLKAVTRSALIKGKMEDLEKAGYTVNTVLPGKIIVVESLTPFNPQNPEKNMKIAGNTGVVCRIDDQPIYRDTVYTTNVNAYDEFISHTNSDEIKDVMHAQNTLGAFTTKQVQDIEL
ncbi:MAG: hypothetical protein ACK52I_30920 [Pseudomonadota bacterium]|jgi:hypothetical protein